jgi:uncharacterized membrane protein YphA (DoxX/SURF4 family)
MNLLEKFVGLVFVSAGLHRLFLKKQRGYETQVLLRLPKWFEYVIIWVEIICGIIILFNLPYKYYAFMTIFIGVIATTFLLLFHHMKDIKQTYYDLFTYHKNSLSVCLHITYAVIVLHLITSYKNKK